MHWFGYRIFKEKKNIKKYGDWITDSDYLYDIAIDYLKERMYQNSKDRDKEDFQVFYNY